MRHLRHLPTISTGALATLLLFASCSKDTVPADDVGSRPGLLQLGTLQTSVVNGAATRTVTTTDYPITGQIGFFVKADAAKKYAACDNYKGTYDATRAKWVPAPEILLNENTAVIAVYAPYDITQTLPAALKLTACLRPADGSRDIWCKRFTANNQSASISTLTLEHVYTRLSLTLSRDAEYKEEARLTDIALTGNEIYAGTTYNLLKTAPYAYDGDPGFVASSTQVLSDASLTAAYDMLLIPTVPLTEDITLAFTVNGKKMWVVIAKEKFTDTAGKLEAGKQYNINLKLVPGKLEIVSVAVVKWDALPQVGGGDAEYEPDTPLAPDGNIDVGGYEPDPDASGEIKNDTPVEI